MVQFRSFKQIEETCELFRISEYKINDDGSIDCFEDINISKKNLNVIPLNFRNVYGNFFCYNNNLTSLEGCPKMVSESFNCGKNNLTSLEGCPSIVGRSFLCSSNKIESLKGCPTNINVDFMCDSNNLINLEGGPEKVGEILMCSNNKLTSLKGCAISVEKLFCSNNKLRNLLYSPKYCTSIVCDNNNLISLEGCTEGLAELQCNENNIKVLYSPKSVIHLFCNHNRISEIKSMPENGFAIYLSGNPINEIFNIFLNNYKFFKMSLDYNYIVDKNKVVKSRLEEAVEELNHQLIDIDKRSIPENLKNYTYI